nr:MAG TPA: hypothetical protein [Caudoviricetes sp.]
MPLASTSATIHAHFCPQGLCGANQHLAFACLCGHVPNFEC